MIHALCFNVNPMNRAAIKTIGDRHPPRIRITLFPPWAVRRRMNRRIRRTFLGKPALVATLERGAT
jgi:hypothetical protein